jgi:hypothetical protein
MKSLLQVSTVPLWALDKRSYEEMHEKEEWNYSSTWRLV